jgi:hypothetical protein
MIEKKKVRYLAFIYFKPTKKPKVLVEIPPTLFDKNQDLPFLQDNNDYEIDPEMFDSREEALELFRKITAPIKTNDFFK